MILTDNETKVDLLNNEPIAETIVQLLRKESGRAVTIGVHGDWGAGKSSILEMIEAGLSGEARVLCLKFNGWRFQGFEDAKIALIEGIVTGLVEKRSTLSAIGDKVKKVFKRIDWLKVARRSGGLALTAFTGIPTPDQIATVVSGLKLMASDPGKLATPEKLEAAIQGVEGVLKPEAETKNVAEEIGEFRKAFDELLNAAGIDQLVVLIDDLDRCLPDVAIETLEAVRLFVFTSRTAFVVAADEAMIEYAVRRHFPGLPDTTGPRDYARNYLEKLIQVPFRIPALGEAETRTYVTLLLIGAELGEEGAGYGKLIKAARERLKRPWEAAGLDAATVEAALEGDWEKAQASLILSDQIGPILAAGTKGNPRQIKRFLNSLLLRKETAKARGFGDVVKLPVLAKFMLAERYLPDLFERVALAAAGNAAGICEDLGDLEAAAGGTKTSAKAPKKGKSETDSASEKKSDVGALGEWLSSPEALAWAKIQPALAGVDLRPYIFVAKDRKDYFGAASILGQLAAVIDRLMGGKFAVRALDGELRELAQPEADKVFDAVCGRVLASGAFETQPAGIDGLEALVKCQPHLQERLVDFLGQLPQDRTGAWAVSGWDSAVTSPGPRERLGRVLHGWSENGGPMLKQTAAAALKKLRS